MSGCMCNYVYIGDFVRALNSGPRLFAFSCSLCQSKPEYSSIQQSSPLSRNLLGRYHNTSVHRAEQIENVNWTDCHYLTLSAGPVDQLGTFEAPRVQL